VPVNGHVWLSAQAGWTRFRAAIGQHDRTRAIMREKLLQTAFSCWLIKKQAHELTAPSACAANG
jgi:hypothetical protein